MARLGPQCLLVG